MDTDYLASLLAPAAPVEKSLTFNGKTGPAYFKLITAGERAQLLKGQRVQATSGEKSTYEIDLGQNAEQKHLLVFFSCCKPDGTRYFRNIEAVRAAPSPLLEKLYALASEVNKETDDNGEDAAGK